MADVNANIGIHIDTSQSLAEIKNLQRQLAQLYTSINKGSAAAAAAQKGLATNLMNTINAGGKFYAQMGTIRTSTESFTHALEKNKLTMREYFRFAGGSTRTFGRLFKSEFDTIGRVAEERVKKMQTQYVKLGRDASGAMRAISVTPTTLNMKEYGNQVAVAAQKQALLNQLLKQGSTNLLNFGKNTQWAGRQLMVGFTIPLAYFGTAAAKTFMDLEAQAIKFRRVYGDMFTTTAETNKALADIQALAEEFTKYGVAVSKTMEMAASAAAMGKTGAELTAQVAQATRLAVLGNVEQEQALTTTISLTNAFGLAAEELTGKINFLNAVENQTVTAIEDLTIAIPKAGPVIESLGGSVEDLAFFLTAMREGGINASEGANALKSGLASLINPTDKAAGMLADMGININAIVEGNFGNLRETVIDFAQALDQLAPLERSRAIEQLFGKFQFARLDALFTNVTKEGGQAARVLDLAGKSVEELAILSERELKAVEDAVGTNFRAAVEELKLAIAPIGKEFLKAITPVVKFLGDLFEKFNNLSDGSKRFIVILTTLVGLVGPTLLMTFGLVANGAANIIKLFLLMRQGFLKLTGNSTNLAQQTQYLNSEQMEAAVVAASLNQAHTKLTQQFTLEASAVMALRNAYVQATTAAVRFAATNPGMMMPGFKGLGPIKGGGAKGFNKGTMEVPGYQKGTDSVPAMLTPGEAVIPEPIAQDDRFKPLVAALVTGEIAKYNTGTTGVQWGGNTYNAASARGAKDIKIFLDSLIKNPDGTFTHIDPKTQKSYTFTNEKLVQRLNYRSQPGKKFQLSEILTDLKGDVKGTAAGTSAPPWMKKLAREAGYANKIQEEEHIRRSLQAKGINPTPDQLKNLFGTQASHILPERGPDGQKIFRAANIVPDAGWVNNYLNTVGKNLGKELMSMTDDQLKALGIDRNELRGLLRGKHPTTGTAAGTLANIARYQISSPKYSKSPTVYQAHAVVAGMDYRANTAFYPKTGSIKTLAQLFPNNKKVLAEIAMQKGEVVKEVGKKPKVVTGQTGQPLRPGQKVSGGGPGDKRVMPASAVARVIPKFRGIKGPNLITAGAQGGYPDGQTAVGPRGLEQRRVAEGIRQSETQVKDKLDKFGNQVDDTTKQTRTLGQKFGVGANVFSGLTIMGSFMGGKIGEVSQKLAPLAIGLSTVAMLLPGLKSGLLKFGTFLAANPFVAVGLAIAGIAVAAKLVDDKMKKQARAQSDYIDAISATTEKMKKVGEVTDEVGASQIMQMRRQGATANRFTTGYERAGQQFGTSFLESEVGKDILTNFQNSLAKGGTNAVKQIALELSAYVSDGLMTAEDANSVARSIGINMSNMALAANIQGQLVAILGPNGEDLTNNPLKVRIDIVEQSRNNIKDFASAISEETKKIGAGGEVYDAGFARDMAAAGAASGVQALEMLQAQRDAQAIMLEDKIKELEIEKSKTKDKEKQAQIESQITTLRSQQATDDQKLAGQRSQIIKDQLALFKASQKVAKGETAFFEGAKQQVVTKFEGDPFVKKFLEESAGLDSKELEVQLLTIVGAGDLTPQAAINFINLFGEDEAKLDTVINSKIAIENPDKFAQLQNLVGGLQGKKAKTVGLDIMTSLTAPGEEGAFEDRLAAITLLQQMDGKEINVAAFLEGDVLGKLDKLVPLLNKVEEKKEINVKVLQELEGETDTDLQGLIDDWEHYVNLPTDIQKTATQTYLTIYKTIGKKELAGELMNQTGGSQVAANFLGERTSSATVRGQLAARLTKEQFAAGQAPNTIPGGPGGKDGGGKGRDTTLDNLLNRLKFIRKASIDAEGGVKELLRITSGKGLTNFGGVMQQLMAGPKGGANREFISFLEGMDNATRKTYMTVKNGEVILTKQGKALKEAFNEKVIGEYQVANRQALQDTKAQGAALLKLQASGVDSATALEMVADANLAVAINSKNITGKELRQMAADAKAAKDEVERLNLEVLGLAESLKKDVADATKTNQALLAARQGGIVDPEILDFISKDMNMVNKILNNGINDQVISDIIKAKNALKGLGDETEALINPAEKAMQTFLKMKDAAFKLFDVQQRQAQSKFNAGMNKTVSTMTQLGKIPQRFQGLSLKSAIAAAEKEVQGLNDQIRTIQDREIRPIDIEIEAKESAINDIMKALESQAAGMQKGFNLPAAAYKDVAEGLRNQINEMELDLEFNPQYGARLVEKLQDQISDIELEIELNFSRPIADLQEESSDLSNDLTLMDRIADQINSKYDAQAEALQKVSDINQEILNQQKSQLDIAGALTQGDIAAAARAAQEARAQAAAGAAQRAGGVLDAARQAEIAGIRSPGGLTRTQIEERQFQIGQQIYQLEEQSEIKQRSILAIQDQIRGIEEIRTQKQREIRDIQDLIAAGERAREAFLRENVVPIENAIAVLQESKRAKVALIAGLEQRILDIQYEILDPLQAEADILQQEYDNAIDLIDKEKQHWEDQELALIVATEETKKFAAEAGKVQDAFKKAKDVYDAIQSKTVTITVKYVYEGSPDTSGSKKDDPKKSTGGLMYGGKIKGYMGGGKVKTMYAAFGKKVGSDTVPAMLTPGEFVVNRASSRAFAPFLSAINESKYPSILARNISESRPIYQIPIQTSLSQPSYEISTPSFVASPTNIANASYSDNSSAVYNYNVGISVGGTSASPDSIAKAVMNEIKYLDSQRVRNQKVS